jgi:GNAT superfamily N-acetyltransferase
MRTIKMLPVSILIEDDPHGFEVYIKPQGARMTKSDWDGLPTSVRKRRFIGNISLVVEETGQWAGWARVTYVHVAAKYRNSGLATRMYYAAVAHVLSRGFKGIYSIPSLRISTAADKIWKKIRNRRWKKCDILTRLESK